MSEWLPWWRSYADFISDTELQDKLRSCQMQSLLVDEKPDDLDEQLLSTNLNTLSLYRHKLEVEAKCADDDGDESFEDMDT